MPFTYFAHQLFVLPFKAAKPRWFDGTALCIGSMAPDFAYALERTPLHVNTHNLLGQLLWTLPVALGLTWLVRNHLALPLGAQLPQPLAAEVQALASSRHARPITAISALLGGLTHLFVDAFTHPHGWAFARFGWLRYTLADGLPVASALQYLGHTLGSALACLWLSRLIAARRISKWNGSFGVALATEVPRAAWFRPVLLRGTLLCAVMGLCALWSTLDISIAIMRSSFLELLLMVGLASGLRRGAAGVSVAE